MTSIEKVYAQLFALQHQFSGVNRDLLHRIESDLQQLRFLVGEQKGLMKWEGYNVAFLTVVSAGLSFLSAYLATGKVDNASGLSVRLTADNAAPVNLPTSLLNRLLDNTFLETVLKTTSAFSDRMTGPVSAYYGSRKMDNETRRNLLNGVSIPEATGAQQDITRLKEVMHSMVQRMQENQARG